MAVNSCSAPRGAVHSSTVLAVKHDNRKTEQGLFCLQEWPVMDFSLIERKVLIASGVTLTLRDLTLSNIR
jgi:hypothetical protein